MLELGPSTPLVGIAAWGLTATCFVIGLTLVWHRGMKVWKPLSDRRDAVVWLLLAATTFVIWGSSSGRGGPDLSGGTTGYISGGLLHYISVISHQPQANAPWSHQLTVQPLALLGTIALNSVVIIVAVFCIRWLATSKPNRT